jgi:hypothetical protein
MTSEQVLWLCYLNGVCQNIVTSFLLWRECKNFEEVKTEQGQQRLFKFFRDNYTKFGWDTDRKWVKNKFEETIRSYVKNVGNNTQEGYFNSITTSHDRYRNFDKLWEVVLNKFDYFGRLATFSYLEYLKIAGINIDCSNLFLEDITGSKSHRNGLCKVLGRDDLDWRIGNEGVVYSTEIIDWLKMEGERLIVEMWERTSPAENWYRDIGYFTLETTLCCYKSWHRENRRYPNVYNDLFYERIKYAERKWSGVLPKFVFNVFWEARKHYLPEYLRKEDNPLDCGVKPQKQNHYLRTGQVIMMDRDWDCFKIKRKPWEYGVMLLIDESDYNDYFAEQIETSEMRNDGVFENNIHKTELDNMVLISHRKKPKSSDLEYFGSRQNKLKIWRIQRSELDYFKGKLNYVSVYLGNKPADEIEVDYEMTNKEQFSRFMRKVITHFK